MTFAFDDAFLPATLMAHSMTDEEFTAFCAEHPDLNFEMSAEGELIVIAPTHSDTGACSLEVGTEPEIGPGRTAGASPAIPPQASFCPMVLADPLMHPGR